MNVEMRPTHSLTRGARTDESALKLYCFHHAGGSAASFGAWSTLSSRGVQAIGIELPARSAAHRAGAAPLRQLVDALAETVARLHSNAVVRPFAFYGHSLGALVAFETVRAMRRRGHQLPLALCVSSRHAPRRPMPCSSLYDRPDDALVDSLRRLGGVPERLLARPRWRALHLPTLRYHLSLTDMYRYDAEAPLDMPLLGFVGLDDPLVSAAEFDAWRKETRGPAVLRSLTGAHFFDRAGMSDLHDHLVTDLRALLTDRRSRRHAEEVQPSEALP